MVNDASLTRLQDGWTWSAEQDIDSSNNLTLLEG
jgi:hypothetical protein